ncbi:Pacrg [Symbiodinium pilosum]|uniref:Pacrg protein n=1 Tax=Symbiodinium pilosum TaxID=2952 RepID=A0A812WZX8_SYMPI|nr:Pacrg [Symbiodinium pilosum]
MKWRVRLYFLLPADHVKFILYQQKRLESVREEGNTRDPANYMQLLAYDHFPMESPNYVGDDEKDNYHDIRDEYGEENYIVFIDKFHLTAEIRQTAQADKSSRNRLTFRNRLTSLPSIVLSCCANAKTDCTPAADKELELPSDPPPRPKAIPPKPKGLLNQGLAMAKDFAVQAASEFFGDAGGKGDPDVTRQCAELYGLFQRKNLMEASTDSMLRVNRGKPKGLADLEDDKAPGGLFIQHTSSHQWYHCFILGKKEEAQLQCVAMEPDKWFAKKKVCGMQACDYDRLTFKTECLKRVVGFVGRPQCVYVGHHGEVHGKDSLRSVLQAGLPYL